MGVMEVSAPSVKMPMPTMIKMEPRKKLSRRSGDTGDTLIAVGTMDPSKPAQTYFAICVPARTCASRVSAAICGVRTAASSSCKGEDVHGSSS